MTGSDPGHERSGARAEIVAAGEGFRVRRAAKGDLEFLLELATSVEVQPFLAAGGPRDRSAMEAEIDRSLEEPSEFGRLVIEVPAGAGWQPAGAMGYEVSNRRSRIARLGGLALLPRLRGRKLADAAARALQRYLLLERDLHRLELEIYGFNERAIRHAARAGFVQEGVKRKAYWRHGEWVDGVFFGLIREDLESERTGAEPR